MEIFLQILALLLAGVVAYLIGSINFAIIVTKLFAKKDIRDFGSGNAGMTNVLRTLGKGPAVLVTLGDFLKGVLAVVIGRLILHLLGGGAPFYGDYLLGLMAMLGHCFPIFYGFRGGKGILVSAGVILMLNWRVLLIILAVFLLVVVFTKTVSLGSISAAAAYPVHPDRGSYPEGVSSVFECPFRPHHWRHRHFHAPLQHQTPVKRDGE